MTQSDLTAKDLDKLREAITFFEHPSLLMKLANRAGLPAQKLLEFVPAQVTTITDDALRRRWIGRLRPCPRLGAGESIALMDEDRRDRAVLFEIFLQPLERRSVQV